MKTLKTSTLLALSMITSQASASDKGILFWLGEKLIGMDGYSYSELESKNKGFLDSLKDCSTYKNNSQLNLAINNKEIENCKLKEKFKIFPNERTIDVNVLDILKSGCTGYMKLQRDTYHPDKETEVSITETKVITKLDNVFKRTLIQPSRKKLDPSDRQPDFINRIEFDLDTYIANHQANKLPPVVLGRIYREDPKKPPQSELGPTTYSYSVLENDSKELEVNIMVEKNSLRNSRGIKELFLMSCICPTVAEILSGEKNSELNKQNEIIRKKVFGN